MEDKFWGKIDKQGSEIWDRDPAFFVPVDNLAKLKLLFYPKKYFLYKFIENDIKKTKKESYKILDIGCGTGANLIDLKNYFGDKVEIFGIDVVALQIDIARQKLYKYNTKAKAYLYNGVNIDFPDNYFDAIYSSDVLGHVSDVSSWLAEIRRVAKIDAPVVMFSESALGRQAIIRNYLLRRGLNSDPHAKFHISLFGKQELKQLFKKNSLDIEKMYGVSLLHFFYYPEEFHKALQSQKKFPILRAINKILFFSKNKLKPFSLAVIEITCLIETKILGKFFEAQGYIILGRKK